MELYDKTNAPRRADTWFVYGLVDSRKRDEIRYIGVTNDLRTRLRRHGNEDSGLHKVRWIKSVERAGGDVLIGILASGMSREDAKFAEIDLIARHRSVGSRLTNMTVGGDGLCGVWENEYYRARMSKMRRDAGSTDIARKKYADMSRIAWSEPKTRASLLQSRRDMWTDEFRAFIGDQRRGKMHSITSKENMSAALRRRFADPREREKISATHIRRYKSDHEREKTSVSKRKSAPHVDNPTGFKGVSLRKDSGRYRARIDLDCGQKNLGTFTTPEDAARAYDKAAFAAWGSDCYLNFPAELAV